MKTILILTQTAIWFEIMFLMILPNTEREYSILSTSSSSRIRIFSASQSYLRRACWVVDRRQLAPFLGRYYAGVTAVR